MIGVMVNRADSKEIFEWLDQHGLQRDADWTLYTVPGSGRMRISFYNEEHAAWFKLRWS